MAASLPGQSAFSFCTFATNTVYRSGQFSNDSFNLPYLNYRRSRSNIKVIKNENFPGDKAPQVDVREISTALSTGANQQIGDKFRENNQESGSPCIYLKKTILNGEVLHHSGSVVIFGDVNLGGTVLADGDVVVLGQLEGAAFAGQNGDQNAKVFALQMLPSQIRIAGQAFTHSSKDGVSCPQIASLSEGQFIFRAAADTASAERKDIDGIHNSRVQKGKALIKKLLHSGPAKVAFVTGLYIIVAGIAFLACPKLLFGILFDLQAVSSGWIRAVAVLAVVFGVYYCGTAAGDVLGLNGAEAFYMSTVLGRTFLFVAFSWLVAVRAVPPPVFLVGAINLAGAMLMMSAIYQRRKLGQS